MTQLKHVGISANRIPREPIEGAFAEAWAERASDTLGYLLYGQDKRNHAVTQREAEIAATLMQWLGSSVGQGFLLDIEERKLYLEREVQTSWNWGSLAR